MICEVLKAINEHCARECLKNLIVVAIHSSLNKASF